MEDLIYILLAVFWIVLGVIGNMKKKKAAQAQKQTKEAEAAQDPAEAAPKPKTEFETIFEELLGESESELEYEEQEAAQPAREKYEEYSQKEDYKFDHEKQEPPAYEQFSEGLKVENDYEFASQKSITIDEMIKAIEESDENRPEITSLGDESSYYESSGQPDDDIIENLIYNPQKAILYSEIINRRY